MSTTLQPNPTTAAPTRYRAVSPLAVLSVVFGVASIVLFFHWTLIVVPLIGLVLGWRALKQIERSDAMTGVNVAAAGMGLSLLLGTLGGVLLLIVGRYEVPMGYKAIAFDDLKAEPGEMLPSFVEKLDGERIFIKGFIYPGRQVTGLKQFIVVPSLNHCNFCSTQLLSTEMIIVEMDGDRTADYTTRLTAIGGRLKLDREAAKERYGSLPYKIICDYVR